MANIFTMVCPKCERDDAIEIVASLMVRVTADGTEVTDGHHGFGSDSRAECTNCDFHGVVADFEPDGVE